jgi:hypothetical protein
MGFGQVYIDDDSPKATWWISIWFPRYFADSEVGRFQQYRFEIESGSPSAGTFDAYRV